MPVLDVFLEVGCGQGDDAAACCCQGAVRISGSLHKEEEGEEEEEEGGLVEEEGGASHDGACAGPGPGGSPVVVVVVVVQACVRRELCRAVQTRARRGRRSVSVVASRAVTRATFLNFPNSFWRLLLGQFSRMHSHLSTNNRRPCLKKITRRGALPGWNERATGRRVVVVRRTIFLAVRPAPPFKTFE